MLDRLLGQSQVPPAHRQTFLHLYLDVGWFGVLSGSAINFVSVYAARLGATGLQIGLLAAVTAGTSLVLALPAGRWLQRRPAGPATFWTSVIHRIGYLLLIPLPWLFSDATQIWGLIAITFMMAVPLTPLAVGFNALFAEVVPSEWRAHVAGVRSATLGIAFMVSSIASGFILKSAEFPAGYQMVFALGALGAAMSSFHIYRLQAAHARAARRRQVPASKRASPGTAALSSVTRLDIWQTRFRRVLLALFAFHVTQYLAVPIFPIFNVRVLDLQDDQIGIGTALFYATVILGSTRIGGASQRYGHRAVTGLGVLGMGIYPLLLSFANRVWHFYGVSLLGGVTWAMAGGAYANYMLEHIPSRDRPPHLAWYNIMLNGAILIGAVCGPLVADTMGIRPALLAFGLARFAAGAAILRWG